MTMLSTIPALPVRDQGAGVTFYRERLGSSSKNGDDTLGIMVRDEVTLHLWEANDPRRPGAEHFLAGSASCRIRVEDVEALYNEYCQAGVIHPNGALALQWWDERDFTILDMAGNALSFFEPI